MVTKWRHLVALSTAFIAVTPALVRAGSHSNLHVSFATTAAECGACHAEQYRQWRYGAGTDLDNGGAGAYHALSSTDGMYQVMLAKMQPDMQAYCQGCHEAGNAWAVPDKITLIPQPRTVNVAEGVNCLTCHFDGTKVVSRAAMQDPLFCATCHNENTGLVEIYDEWVRDYTGGKTCQQCHMPDGNHASPGFHGTSFIRQALVAQAPVLAAPVVSGVPFAFRFDVTNAGTGHSVPEDLFRLLTVRAAVLDASGGELYECVKTYYKRNTLFGEDPATTEVIRSGATATVECGGAVVPSRGTYTIRIELLQDSNRVEPSLNRTVFMGSTYGSFVAN
jgi:cytochrome c7-like protein